MEDEIKKNADIPHISIFKPGAIINRSNDFRLGEFFLKFFPFISKIESKDVGKSMRLEAEL